MRVNGYVRLVQGSFPLKHNMFLFCYLVKNEILKELYTSFSYRLQWLGELLGVTIFYFYLSYISVGRGFSFDSYSIWFFSIALIGDLSGKIANEMNLGIFEQNYLSIFSIKKLFIAKIAASIVRIFSILIILQIMHFFVSFQTIAVSSYLIMLAILPSLIGISFMLTGLTLILKDIGWLINILNNSLLFISGMFFASELFPKWIKSISFLFPTRLGYEFYNPTLSPEWIIFMFCFQSCIYPLIGSIVLRFSETKARLSGCSGFY